MQFFNPIRRTCVTIVTVSLLFVAACGDPDPVLTNAGGPTDPTLRESQPVAAVQADDLIANGDFSAGLSRWTATNVTLTGSPLRSGGQALAVGQSAMQALPADALVAGRAYALVVMARVDSATRPAQMTVNFRRPAGAELTRSYQTALASTDFRLHRLEFTAPPYAKMAEISVQAGDTPVTIDSISLTQRAPIEQTEAVTTLQDSHVPASYVLAFNDEFNGTELNRSKWFTRYIFSGGSLDRLNDEKQRYRDNLNHQVANGVLSLTARKVSGNDPGAIDYESGMIRSDWTARYGFFETRVRMPSGRGAWPAFWLASDIAANGTLSWPPEIDIFEFVNNGVEDTADMLHSNVINPAQIVSVLSYADPLFDPTWSYYRAPFKFDAGWHTVGAEWTPEGVTMYIDGKKIYSRGYLWNFPDGSPAGPAHILLNLAIGGAWAGRHGIDDAAFPQSLQIDWVRAYRKGG